MRMQPESRASQGDNYATRAEARLTAECLIPVFDDKTSDAVAPHGRTPTKTHKHLVRISTEYGVALSLDGSIGRSSIEETEAVVRMPRHKVPLRLSMTTVVQISSGIQP